MQQYFFRTNFSYMYNQNKCDVLIQNYGKLNSSHAQTGHISANAGCPKVQMCRKARIISFFPVDKRSE